MYYITKFSFSHVIFGNKTPKYESHLWCIWQNIYGNNDFHSSNSHFHKMSQGDQYHSLCDHFGEVKQSVWLLDKKVLQKHLCKAAWRVDQHL